MKENDTMEFYTKEDAKRFLVMGYLMNLEDDQASDDDYRFDAHHDDDETLFKLILEIDHMREAGETSLDLIIRYKQIQNNK